MPTPSPSRTNTPLKYARTQQLESGLKRVQRALHSPLSEEDPSSSATEETTSYCGRGIKIIGQSVLAAAIGAFCFSLLFAMVDNYYEKDKIPTLNGLMTNLKILPLSDVNDTLQKIIEVVTTGAALGIGAYTASWVPRCLMWTCRS